MSQSIDIPPPSALQRHATLETDQFCDCGYNLHGQVVSRDERLDFMVCRCPECARWHPAGEGASARRLWLSRIGVFFLTAWIVFAVGVVATLVFILGALQMAHVEKVFTWAMFDAQGREMEYDPEIGDYVMVGTGQTTQPSVGVTSKRVFRTTLNNRQIREEIEINIVSTIFALLLGGFLSIAAWHVKRRRYFWVLLLPVVAALFVYYVTLDSARYATERGNILPWLSWFVAMQAFVVWLGTFMGRPVARTAARIFVPPKPRQVLNFLWHADGKSPPPLKQASVARI
jgi:hypothetical protein